MTPGREVLTTSAWVIIIAGGASDLDQFRWKFEELSAHYDTEWSESDRWGDAAYIGVKKSGEPLSQAACIVYMAPADSSLNIVVNLDDSERVRDAATSLTDALFTGS